MSDEKTPQYVRCGECNHQWLGFHFPIEVRALSKEVLNMCCPSCGADIQHIYLSDGEDDA